MPFRFPWFFLVLFVSFSGFAESKSEYFGTFPSPAPDEASLKISTPDWYKDEVFYHIWLPAFADSNGDGVGDLPGITSRLGDLDALGVTSLWLSPFWSSPSNHGYDVVDYAVVDRRYGTNADLKVLLQAAHARGMKVIFDFVPNHVSARNPWFTDSRDNKNGRRTWFLWKNPAPRTGWLDFGGRPAWHQANGSSYYALFWDQMPDLNYREPEVRQATAGIIAQWLNFGFDGMRVDAVKYLFENETTGANADQPETMEFFRRLRAEVLDPYTALGFPKFMVAENWTSDFDSLTGYLSSDGKRNDGLHATLDFPFGYAVTNILNGTGTVESDWGREYENLIRPVEAAGGWTLTFLSNHDNYQSRPATLYGEANKVKVAMTMQMTGWGTPVLYYGNEAGMKGANGNDGNMRRPLPWAEVAAARSEPASVWNWQASLDRLRRDHPALRRGDLQILAPSPDDAAVFVRRFGNDRVVVVLNVTEAPLAPLTVEVPGAPHARVTVLAGTPAEASMADGVLTVTGLGGYGIQILQVISEGD